MLTATGKGLLTLLLDKLRVIYMKYYVDPRQTSHIFNQSPGPTGLFESRLTLKQD